MLLPTFCPATALLACGHVSHITFGNYVSSPRWLFPLLSLMWLNGLE